jgi:hypothetical protein
MPESPRRVDLRLTIPASAAFRAVAVELAEKFAEHAGDANPASVGARVAASIADAARTAPAGDITIEMSATNGGVAIRAHQKPD